LVDDVIYVYGGRGVDGKDLGDLGAFKISSALPSFNGNTAIFGLSASNDELIVY
jgi:hypothetical protein